MAPVGEQLGTTAVDVELAGDILRVATSGLPELIAANAIDALRALRSEHKPFRDFLNQPPNGNHLINSCLLYPPFDPGSDGALFLASRFAYAPYAGTALMAAATVLAEAQGHELTADQQRVALDTACGVMEIELGRRNNVVTHAKWFVNAPNLLTNNDKLRRDAGDLVEVSLVDAGLPYLVVDASKLGIELANHSRLADTAMELSAAASKQFPMARFGIGGNYDRYLVMFVHKIADTRIKTVWVSDKGEVANSAGGTGALSVLMACEGNGMIPHGNTVAVEAPGGVFECQINGKQATVTANVRIVAKHTFLSAPH